MREDCHIDFYRELTKYHLMLGGGGAGGGVEVQMKCFFFIAEFQRAAKIRKIAVYRFLISLLVPEL